MSTIEIKAKVDAALVAYEDIPFRELVAELGRRIGPRRADAYKPALVTANQLLRFIADDLARAPEVTEPPAPVKNGLNTKHLTVEQLETLKRTQS